MGDKDSSSIDASVGVIIKITKEHNSAIPIFLIGFFRINCITRITRNTGQARKLNISIAENIINTSFRSIGQIDD